jgi:hypothetical protein
MVVQGRSYPNPEILDQGQQIGPSRFCVDCEMETVVLRQSVLRTLVASHLFVEAFQQTDGTMVDNLRGDPARQSLKALPNFGDLAVLGLGQAFQNEATLGPPFDDAVSFEPFQCVAHRLGADLQLLRQ